MSRNDQRQAPDGPASTAKPPHAEAMGVAGLLQWAEQMVLSSSLVLDDPGEDADAPYARAFVLGEALARRFRRRCSQHHGPHGLAVLLEQLACGPAREQDDPARASARAGLFSGFCWDLERSMGATPPDARGLEIDSREDGANDPQSAPGAAAP